MIGLMISYKFSTFKSQFLTSHLNQPSIFPIDFPGKVSIPPGFPGWITTTNDHLHIRDGHVGIQHHRGGGQKRGDAAPFVRSQGGPRKGGPGIEVSNGRTHGPRTLKKPEYQKKP